MYDRNGNATLKIESMNTDLRNQVIATGVDLEKLLQNVDMMQTFTRYDARNQVIQIRQPKTSGGVPYVYFSPVDIPIDGGVFANTQLSISGWINSGDRPVTGPTLPVEGGNVSIVGGSAQASVTASWASGTSVSNLSISVPALQGAYGPYDVSAVVTYRATGTQWSGGPNNQSTSVAFDTGEVKLAPVFQVADGATTLSVPIGFSVSSYNTYYAYATGPVNFQYSVQLYITPRNQISPPQLIGTIAKGPVKLYDVNGEHIILAAANALDSTLALNVPATNSLTVANGTLPHSQGMLYYRPSGSTQNFQALPKRADSQPNSYTADIASLADGDYEMIFLAVSDGGSGPAGTLLRRDGYTVHISRTSGSTVTHVDIPQQASSSRAGFNVDASGSYIWSAPQVLNIYSALSTERKLVDHLSVHVRKQNDPNWQVDIPVYRNSTTGAFTVDMSGYGTGTYGVSIDLCDAAGAALDSMRGSVNLPGGSQTSSLSLGYLADLRSTVEFKSQPASTDYMVVSWVQNGVTQYATLRRQSNQFLWDTTQYGLLPDTKYAIKFTSYDAAGSPLSMGQGDITIGVNSTSQVTLTGSSKPSIFEFHPTDSSGKPLANVDSLTLSYRQSTQKDDQYDRPFTTVTIRKDALGRFLFDATSLPTNVEYEYRYLAKDAAGNVLMERQSYFLTGTRNNPVTNVDVVGVTEELAKDMTIDRQEQHNAFGEVSGERDGRGNWTYSSYNTMGFLVLKQEPKVKVTLANGVQIETTPLTNFYYDRTGNLVGLKDANGYLTTKQWNYGLAKPAVSKSWDALGYSKAYQYDSFGNVRVSLDELNRRTDYSYDAENRLAQVTRPTLANGQRSTDRYEYDAAGNRIAHTDALGGREKTYFDIDGRIVKTVSAAGRAVQYDYRWANNIASIGTSMTGGWIKTTTDANGRTMVDESDVFGRVSKHTDLGGHVFRYTYNWAGLVTKQTGTTGQDVDYTYYSHGLVRSIMDNATKTQSLYEYDGDGNRTAEYFTNFANSYVFAQSRVEYDALNRVTSISDNSYQVSYEYDAVGNRRRMLASYTDMVNYHQKLQEYWYEYDALNRFTVSMGTLSGARATDPNDASVHIVVGAAGGDGVQLGYDAAGQRVLAVYGKDGRTERYTYDANGYLETQTINGVLAQQRTNDLLGRVTGLVERDVKTGSVVTNATRVWDADSLQVSERDTLHGVSTTYTRMADGTLTMIDTKPDDTKATRTTSTYTYEWWDGAKQSSVVVQPTNPNSPGWKAATSTYNYDANGNLKSTYDDGGNQPGNARGFQYWTDLRGQVQRRDELTGVTVTNGKITGATGDRKHNYYYLNGNRVGNQGNDGIDSIDYVQELAGKLGKGNESQFKVFTPISTADFDENYMAINATYPGSSPGQWTVRDGDTLQSIASALWGDATLWYILADANGLQGTDTLKGGQVLTVPNKVTNVHNTATTFKPYDPGKAIGDTQPTLPDPPPPPEANGCGAFVQIIAIVVAVVVTVVTYGAASSGIAAAAGTTGAAAGSSAAVGTAVAAGAVAGAAGAAASQTVMIAGGQQSGFNWNGVAMGALGGAVTFGLNASGLGAALSSGLDSQVASQVALGAVRSGMTQGLGVITGAQHSFDWKGMAASAIASGVGGAVGQTSLGQTQYLGSMLSGLAAGVTSTLVRGDSLQRNMGAIAMDAVASTIGNMVVDQVQAASVGKTATYTHGSMSSLYGVGGNYDDAVRQATQSSYNVSAGDQFAGMAGWNLALQAQPENYAAAGTSGGRGSMPAMYGGSGFNAEQARMQRIADMQIEAINPAIVHSAPALGELNVLVTGVGSRYDPDGYPLPNAGSAVSMAKAVGSWLDTPIGALENLSQTVLKGNAIMAEGLDAVGLHGLASAQMGLGQVTSSSVPTRPWEVALSAAPLAGEVGPAMRAGAAMFGPKLAGMTESYLARTGGLSYVTEPSLTLGGTLTGLDRLVPGSEFVTGLEFPATSINSADALARKFGALQDAQINAAKTINAGDGRTLYFSEEVPARTLGPTRGASLVTEFNAETGSVRQYYESYDHTGAAIRVHPKMINGQVVNSWHYPPTGKELGR
ncbi:hypothetical protein PTKU46_74710 [Paraburkholderia terrae]|uniref:LysM peptidoglycan-binding domain-containing protein n=1 Tax=Paraburkholderia terrae TaxID=311230 RepID=UPI0030DF4EC4